MALASNMRPEPLKSKRRLGKPLLLAAFGALFALVFFDLRRGYKVGQSAGAIPPENIIRSIKQPSVEDRNLVKREYGVSLTEGHSALFVNYDGPYCKAPLPFMVFNILEVNESGIVTAVHLAGS